MNGQISFVHCGSPPREPLHYTACGLDNVYLTSGYEVRTFDGEKHVAVHDVEQLYAAIAVYLVRHKKVLAGPEVRFLRKYLDLTQRELGELLFVSDQSVARYEKGQTALDGSTDGLLRLLVSNHVSGSINVREELEKISCADDAPEGEITLGRDDDGWRAAA